MREKKIKKERRKIGEVFLKSMTACTEMRTIQAWVFSEEEKGERGSLEATAQHQSFITGMSESAGGGGGGEAAG